SARNLGGFVAQFRIAGGTNHAPVYQPSAPAPRAAAPRPAAAPVQARPVASPARKMVGNLAKAFGGGNTAAATAQDNWEEF
ncbi:MAG: methyl-accepting chemotaxis protein, partial [Rhizobium rhizophilum]